VGNKIFVGGLNYQTSEQQLKDELGRFGKVISIRIVTDKETGRSKGFGFATFENDCDAVKAIDELNNSVFDGRRIGVKEAIERKNN
jgi:RNA recognition motif-containing protein